jgi:hypothetical protein
VKTTVSLALLAAVLLSAAPQERTLTNHGLSEQLALASDAATQQRKSLRQQIKEHEPAHDDIAALR